MNIKERMMKQAEKLIDISIKAHQECADYYPKHMKTISKLVSIFMDLVMFDKYDLTRFHDYLEEFSNYIAKKYFSDEVNKLWRKPLILEKEVMKYFFWEKDNLWNNERKTMFNESMGGFLKAHDLTPEKHLGQEYYTTEQVARLFDISIEELNKFTEEHQYELKGHILKLKKRKDGYSIVFNGEDLELSTVDGIQEVKKEKTKKTSQLKTWL